MRVRHFINTLLLYPVSTSMHSSRMLPLACCPYLPTCTAQGWCLPPGVVSASGGVCSGGWCLLTGSVCSRGVSASKACLLLGGVFASGPGGCLPLVPGGVCFWSGGGCIPACTGADTTLPCEQNDRQV